MTISACLEQRGITKYRLAKDSGVPYATVSDIVSGRARLEKCSAETVYKLAKALAVPMETLLEPCLPRRCGFELFKSQTCHRLRRLGDIDFVIETLERDDIRAYARRGWYPECFYLLAMLDHLSRLNHVPVCTRYNDLRMYRLKETLFPASVRVAAAVAGAEPVKAEALKEAIPEFLRFNIVESEVRDVV